MQLCARRRRFGSKFGGRRLREQPFELPGKRLPVALAEGWRPAGIHAARAQLVHEFTHGEPRFDIVPGIDFAARIEHAAALGERGGGERGCPR